MTEAEQERAKVVAWLREWGDGLSEDAIIADSPTDYARAFQLLNAANRIERGEHLKEREG